MSQTTQKLVTDLRVLLADAKDLMQATATQGGEKIAEMRARIQRTIAEIEPRLSAAEAALEMRVKEAAKSTDDYVHAQPWAAVGIAAGAGLLIGLLAGRR
jgi:ElaB/YqjD/DUF883 family membrane-anchored ribosome-binding protein